VGTAVALAAAASALGLGASAAAAPAETAPAAPAATAPATGAQQVLCSLDPNAPAPAVIVPAGTPVQLTVVIPGLPGAQPTRIVLGVPQLPPTGTSSVFAPVTNAVDAVLAGLANTVVGALCKATVTVQQAVAALPPMPPVVLPPGTLPGLPGLPGLPPAPQQGSAGGPGTGQSGQSGPPPAAGSSTGGTGPTGPGATGFTLPAVPGVNRPPTAAYDYGRVPLYDYSGIGAALPGGFSAVPAPALQFGEQVPGYAPQLGSLPAGAGVPGPSPAAGAAARPASVPDPAVTRAGAVAPLASGGSRDVVPPLMVLAVVVLAVVTALLARTWVLRRAS
jgi:hypothetical protein